MTRSHTVKMIVDGTDYFAALTDANGIRFGMVGGGSFEVPNDGRKDATRAFGLDSESEVEAMFDEFMDRPGYVYRIR